MISLFGLFVRPEDVLAIGIQKYTEVTWRWLWKGCILGKYTDVTYGPVIYLKQLNSRVFGGAHIFFTSYECGDAVHAELVRVGLYNLLAGNYEPEGDNAE